MTSIHSLEKEICPILTRLPSPSASTRYPLILILMGLSSPFNSTSMAIDLLFESIQIEVVTPNSFRMFFNAQSGRWLPVALSTQPATLKIPRHSGFFIWPLHGLMRALLPILALGSFGRNKTGAGRGSRIPVVQETTTLVPFSGRYLNSQKHSPLHVRVCSARAAG